LSDLVAVFGFTAGAGSGNNANDVINLSGAPGLVSFSGVLNATTEYHSGADFGVVIQLDANSQLVLANVLKSQLVADDFAFI
jgi:hypothetical protein